MSDRAPATPTDRHPRTASVHFVVCCRNNRDIIGDTLAAIASQDIAHARCTVVDGRSSDGTVELVRERHPWVEVVVKDTDSGPADSRNIGARASDTDFVVFVDSDVCLAPDWTRRQLALMATDQHIGIACGKVVYADRPHTLNMAHGTLNRLGIAWDLGRDEPAEHHDHPAPALWCASAAIIVRRQLLVHAGDFDAEMFAYHEDTDLGWRANLFGYRVMFNPGAIASHRAHATMNVGTMGKRPVYLAWRNRLRSALVNYELASLARYVPLYLGLAALLSLGRGEFGLYLRGLGWNLRMLGDTLRRRRFVQHHRVHRDRQLWHLFDRRLRGVGR
ncbi:MAG: glycosyltransferase [Ectothiorhodospiraceae bacterium]|nr:glycosyltransferase [Ectothiorhodospiraceae bacterium]